MPPRQFFRWAHFLVLPVSLLLAVPVSGAVSGNRLAGLPPIVSSWLREDGLPQNSLAAIHQAQDGYLWLGTYNGLARFDGSRFEVFGPDRLPGLLGNRITAVWEDGEGVLWVGEETGNLVRVMGGGKTSEAVVPQWEPRPIIQIRGDETGETWILDRSGRLIRVSDGFTHVVLEESVTEPGVWKIVGDTEGAIWFLGYLDYGEGSLGQARLARLRNGEITRWEDFGDTSIGIISGIGESRRGGVWILAEEGIRRWENGDWIEDRGADPFPDEYLSAFYETKDGTLVLGVLNVGTVLVAPGAEARLISTDDGLLSDWVTAIAEDREGNVWLATAAGLNSLRPRRAEMVEPGDRFGRKSVLGLAQDPDGSLWIGTEGAGLYQYQNGHFRHAAEGEGLTKTFVWAVEAEPEGRVWVGTWGQGLFVGQDGRYEAATGWNPAATIVTALLRGRDGSLWAGTNLGLEHWDGTRWTSWQQVGGQVVGHVRCLAEDRQGRIWFGTSGHGLGYLDQDQGQGRMYGLKDGLSSNFVWALLPREPGLWIGTAGGGLGFFSDGKFSWLTTTLGMPSDVICSISVDQKSRFWFTSFSGVFSISEPELEASIRSGQPLARPLLLDASDGLPTSECVGGMQAPALLEKSGIFWVSTTRGLVRIDTTRIQRQSLVPLIRIQNGMVGDDQVSNEWDDVLVVPPGRHRVEVNYSAIHFSAPGKVFFRYRLEGLENQWVDLGNQRSVSFSYLPPGRYRLHLVASNRDGFWNEDGASLLIVVKPRWWEIVAVRVVGILAAGGLFGFLVRHTVVRRGKRRVDELQREHAVERERTRISRDLHDDLGASLTRLNLLSQTHEFHDERAFEAHVNQMRLATLDITRSMDEVVWAVTPRHDTLESLVAYLARFAQEFLTGAGVRCRLDLPLDIPEYPLTAEFRHNLFLACKESLHNVVRHASATQVCLSLRCDWSRKLLVITLTDDGGGFEREQVAAGTSQPGEIHGNGLSNMYRRLAALGGQATIASVLEQGTTVRFEVPLFLQRKGKK